MPPSAFSKILLLIDQAQISIEERNRLILFGNEPSEYEDEELLNSLKHISGEIHKFEGGIRNQTDSGNLRKLLKGYSDLLDQIKKHNGKNIDGLQYVPREPPLPDDDFYDEDVPPKLSKSVRFKDKLVEEEPERPETFIEPYRDDPEVSSSTMYQQNHVLMEQQDQRLDRLSASVGRQHELSIQIDDELSTHMGLLDEVDQLTDRSQSRLEQARKRLEKFSRKAAQNGSWLTIFILFVIFIILVLVLK